jgi:hypothetical protein
MKSTFKITLLSLAFLAGVLVSTTVRAQDEADSQIAIRPAGYGYAGPYFYSHASTYEEGVLRGWADLWRSKGDYNYITSLANVNNQEAYSRALDNSVKRADAYFARRAINEQGRQSLAQPRPSAEDIVRFAKERAPGGLNPQEFTAAIGHVNWPAILEDGTFAAERNELDRLFAARDLDDSGLGSRNHRQIKQTADQMLAKLKSRIGEYSPAEYVTAKSFLTRLERESMEGVSPLGVASR